MLCLATHGQAETWTVCAEGCNFDRIQEAINAASDDDIIEITAGVYYESNLDPGGKAITIRSVSGEMDVVIDGTQTGGQVIRCISGETTATVFMGLIVTGGSSSWGAGLYLNHNSSPTLIRCSFQDNSAGNYGGGAAVVSSAPIFEECTFTNNWATTYGGGLYNAFGNPTLVDCVITHNDTLWNVGGMWSDPNNSLPVLTNSMVCDNLGGQISGPWVNNGGNCVDNNCEDCEVLDCEGDLDASGDVGIDDLLIIIDRWGTDEGDADGDGDTDIDDILVVIGHWGSCA